MRFVPAAVLIAALVAFLALRVLDPEAPDAPLASAPEQVANSQPPPAADETLAAETEIGAPAEPEAMLEAESASQEALHDDAAEAISGIVNADAEAFADEPLPPEPLPESPATVLNFDELQTAIDLMLLRYPGRISVSVLSEQGFVFGRDAGSPFVLASVVKIYLLAGYLDFLAQQPREPDALESFMLEAMIGWSDNDAAEYIWQLLGRTEAMQLYLESRGLSGLLAADDDSWGGSSASTADLALFLSQLASGLLLDEGRTNYAMSLLSSVEVSQRWGVTSGLQEVDPEAAVFLKNGWYPEFEGWRVNSAGLIVPTTGAAPYVIVVFGDGFADFDDGVEVIESIARLANGLMLRPTAALESSPKP